MTKRSCVYKLTNRLTGKIYVGATTNYATRIYYHEWYAANSARARRYQPITNAIKEHGWSNFSVEVLEDCSPGMLIKREAFYITSLRATDPDIGYNVLHSGFSRKGVKHRQEVVERIAETVKRVIPRGDAHYQKRQVNWTAVRAMHAVIDGKPRSEEVKQKMRDKLKGRRCPWMERAVVQLDPVSLVVIKEWPSAVAAMRNFSSAKNASNIQNCCTFRKNQDGIVQKTAYGFAWRFADQWKAQLKSQLQEVQS